MTAKTLMILGTCSSAGKSLLTAALCRIFARRGMRVAPYKAQNMSNNAAVCDCGGEIGRSQALQARAARVVPTPDMNPVLLKPESDSRSQVIVQGRPWKTLGARNYYNARDELWPKVTQSLDRLREAYDLIVMEGAGSPAELNLQGRDIVNLSIARHARAPVLLVGDIERGGVFAQLLGTLWLLPATDRALVRGLLVNKFRGDRSLFDEGVHILEQRGEVPVAGVVPFIHDLNLPEEDAADLSCREASGGSNVLDIAIVRLPHIANFDDFDPLLAEPNVEARFVESVSQLGQPDAVILPGTKSTMADLEWLQGRGLDVAIHRLAECGCSVVGICGGYQMLGQAIIDPDHVESQQTEATALGLLATRTEFKAGKNTYQVEAEIEADWSWLAANKISVTGYEIHTAFTQGGPSWLTIRRRNGEAADVADGASTEDGRVWGCYLHGLFANDDFRRRWLASLRGGCSPNGAKKEWHDAPSDDALETSLDRLADVVEESVDVEQILQIIEEPQ